MKIGISIGDLAGIGPEVTLKALQQRLPEGAVPVIFGSPDFLRREDARLAERVEGYAPLADQLVELDHPGGHVPDGVIGVVDVAASLEDDPDNDLDRIDISDLTTGEHDPRCAHIQLEAFNQAVDAARSKQTQAVVTAPWNKQLFQTIGEPAVGHTDILADMFPAYEPVMMLGGDRLKVTLVTTHVPLKRVSERLTHGEIRKTIRTTAGAMRRRFGVDVPRVAICGLNPHAGEGGVIGDEELKTLIPAVEEAQREFGETVDLEGPLPADTLFAKYKEGRKPFHAVVCMYHDQGLIPIKLMHFGESANITLGLPIIRTSVDHGTAYDIAGEGVADAGSMRYALEAAVQMVLRT